MNIASSKKKIQAREKRDFGCEVKGSVQNLDFNNLVILGSSLFYFVCSFSFPSRVYFFVSRFS